MIYLDHHAATPLCAAAADAMALAGDRGWANPDSVHRAGRAARALLEQAREQVAGAVGAAVPDVVLTAGGTEACNLGVLGLVPEPAGRTVITTDVEHPAVAAAIARLARSGARVIRLSVPDGRAPAPEVLRQSITRDTALVALQWVNHETGTLLPIAAYADLCADAGVPLFVDGIQAAGKVPVNLARVPLSALALASHKLGGPSGAGALCIRRSQDLHPQALGGGQERGRRAGTPAVLNLVGFGAACETLPWRLSLQPQIAALREAVEAGLGATSGAGGDGTASPATTPVPWINGAGGPRVATVTNLSFRGCRGPELVAALDIEGVCCASGAACSSGLAEPSPVITAMYPKDSGRAQAAVRFSFGPEALGIDAENIVSPVRAVLRRVSPDSS